MSATRDKNQRTTFVYSNLYQLYRKGKTAANGLQEAQPAQPNSYFQLPGSAPTSGNVLKAQDLKQAAVSAYQPPSFINKRVVERPPTQNSALQGLKDNLKTLNDLHSRLQFMLQELEDLVKE